MVMDGIVQRYSIARLLGAIAIIGLVTAPLPAWSNCTVEYVNMDAIRSYQAKAIAKLKAGKDGAYIGRFENDAVYMMRAFDNLPGPAKRTLVTPLPGAFSKTMTPKQVEQVTLQGSSSPVVVRDQFGRALYTETPCFGDFVTLTEHDRYLAMFSFNTSDETEFRAQTHRLPAAISLKYVKKKFASVMSWDPKYFIHWVPEGGFFEINIESKAELKRLEPFWAKAPRGYRYDVVLNDGTLVACKAL
jgi:hypothetical protein